MYQYTDFDRRFVHARAAQYRDQLERHLNGQLGTDEFRALRLQNGWYIQRHAPMLRVAVPYGELSSRQLRQLAKIAREYDRQPDGPFAGQGGYAHFTTRQNVQYNWIPLKDSATVMELLAEVDMHGIQTSGNCIRNITSDAFVGIAPDDIVDARPYCEILRHWSTLHPEFAHLPRKFKIAVSGAAEDRAAIGWHDIGLQLKKNAAGEVGFQVFVGGGMGRTPIPGVEINAFVPWQQILVYIEAIVRCYNLAGRRDNLYKARIKILVKAEGQKFFDAVNEEYARILADDNGGHEHIIPQTELDRVAACFVDPAGVAPTTEPTLDTSDNAFARWLERNVHGHRVAGYRAVTLSLKRVGIAPGDTTADVMDTAAALADQFSHGELRATHRQNIVLPWVKASDLPALFQAARAAGFATPNAGLLTDQIACPGGDFCALANARSLPIAAEIAERYQDQDELEELGEIDLHISGCINSCGHHHSGHIGILGVDKDGTEWYQLTLGGGDGTKLAGGTVAGKVIGPSFAADEIADAIDAVIETFKRERLAGEHFIDAVKRLGLDPFKTAANAVRVSTAKA
ncbi:nitrite/sulfite reductase [Roseateles asaccharophilus]|uniref:Sulfite reductase (NADPH) hemoprotein beta-component n=1 Tax=Roseateles asaccharophilus TaxID=582607 RepID=A0ABU2AFF3_9BURK|nr:nitrite/sulfite reductase [Roseateles asaccharophilus]MDR7335944.1 sulfite reductase (NADPH) hemoprotein beta-component [Roseateles asaccharophilus]